MDIERLRRVARNGWVLGSDVLELIDAYEALVAERDDQVAAARLEGERHAYRAAHEGVR